jgi:hypothetical protein
MLVSVLPLHNDYIKEGKKEGRKDYMKEGRKVGIG